MLAVSICLLHFATDTSPPPSFPLSLPPSLPHLPPPLPLPCRLLPSPVPPTTGFFVVPLNNLPGSVPPPPPLPPPPSRSFTSVYSLLFGSLLPVEVVEAIDRYDPPEPDPPPPPPPPTPPLLLNPLPGCCCCCCCCCCWLVPWWWWVVLRDCRVQSIKNRMRSSKVCFINK